MKKIALAIALASVVTSPAVAAHNNPWATTQDTILGKKHDENQEKSVGKPGQDQMQGTMAQNGSANVGGGFGGVGPSDGSGHGGAGNGGGGGAGNGGGGGAGNGGGGGGGAGGGGAGNGGGGNGGGGNGA